MVYLATETVIKDIRKSICSYCITLFKDYDLYGRHNIMETQSYYLVFVFI